MYNFGLFLTGLLSILIKYNEMISRTIIQLDKKRNLFIYFLRVTWPYIEHTFSSIQPFNLRWTKLFVPESLDLSTSLKSKFIILCYHFSIIDNLSGATVLLLLPGKLAEIFQLKNKTNSLNCILCKVLFPHKRLIRPQTLHILLTGQRCRL